MAEIEGLEKLQKKLKTLEAFQNKLAPPMTKAVALIHDGIANYPPKPAHSTYRRTGTLGRRWTSKVKKMSSGVMGEVGNLTSYAPYVQSAQMQVSFHKRAGWKTDKQVLATKNKEIARIFEDAIKRELRK